MPSEVSYLSYQTYAARALDRIIKDAGLLVQTYWETAGLSPTRARTFRFHIYSLTSNKTCYVEVEGVAMRAQTTVHFLEYGSVDWEAAPNKLKEILKCG